MQSTIARNCGVLRTNKLKGGGVKLMKPKPCEGYIQMNLSFDQSYYVGTCKTCGFRKTEKVKVLA